MNTEMPHMPENRFDEGETVFIKPPHKRVEEMDATEVAAFKEATAKDLSEVRSKLNDLYEGDTIRNGVVSDREMGLRQAISDLDHLDVLAEQRLGALKLQETQGDAEDGTAEMTEEEARNAGTAIKHNPFSN